MHLKEFLKPKDLYLLTNMRKAILQKGIMEDVKMSIIAENLAIERAKKLFKADYANVQPHSGSSANAAAYLALS